MLNGPPDLLACYIVTPWLGTGHQVRRPALLGAGDCAPGGHVAGNSLNGDFTHKFGSTDSCSCLAARQVVVTRKRVPNWAGQTHRTALQILAPRRCPAYPENTAVRLIIRPAIRNAYSAVAVPWRCKQPARGLSSRSLATPQGPEPRSHKTAGHLPALRHTRHLCAVDEHQCSAQGDSQRPG